MKTSRHAFTLVELMIAVAITSLLVVVLVNVVSAALGAWQQGRNQIDTFAGARQMLGRIVDELKGAVASNQAQFVENVSALDQGYLKPDTAENIFFVASYPNAGAGDFCVIAYRLNTTTHALERAFLDSQAAWNSGAANRYQVAGYASSAFVWRPVVSGVLEFELRCFSQDDLDQSRDASNTPPSSWDSAGGNTFMQSNTPRRIVVRARLIDDKNLVTLGKVPVNSTQYNTILARAARDFLADTSLLQPR